MRSHPCPDSSQPSTSTCPSGSPTTSGPSSRSSRGSWTNVESVEQVDDRTLRWVASIAGQRKDWTAEITDQTPDTRIAWRSTSGDKNDGAVLFQSLDDNRTRVTLRIEADPQGPVETVGAALGILERAVEGDLKRFKEFIESREVPTGAWRGEIHGETVVSR